MSHKRKFSPYKNSMLSTCVALGIEKCKLLSWAKYHDLPLYPVADANGLKLVEVRDIIRLAREHPELFGGLKRENLLRVLQDTELVEKCMSYPKPPSRLTKPIRCIDTGEVFPSAAAAALAKDIDSVQTLRNAVNCGCRAAGLHWEYIVRE